MKSSKLLAYVLSSFGIIFTALFYMKSASITWQFGFLILYAVVHFWLLIRNFGSLGWSWNKGSISVIFAAAWVYSSHDKPFGQGSVLYLLVSVLAIAMFAFTAYVLLTELDKPFKGYSRSASRGWIVLYAVIPIVVWVLYFLAYYPGKMTYDSFWQWDQAHGIKLYNDWHPILHTWLIQSSTWIYNSPATYVALQILVVALVLAYALSVLQRFGMPIWLILIADVVYALNPVNGFYVITMWKDIPFAAVILFLTAIFARIAQSRGRWLQNNWHYAIFIVACFAAMNLRHNGPEAVLAALVFLILLMKETRIRVIVSLVPILGCYWLFNGPLMSYAHVVKNPLNQALAVPSQQIGATYKYHGKFTPALAQYFDSILPAENWAKDYSPYTVNPIKHDSKYNASVIQNSFSLYLKNWAGLLALNPTIYVSAYLKQVAVIWQFHSVKGLHPYFDTPIDLQQYPVGLRLMSPDKTAKGPVNTLIQESYQQYVQEAHTHFPGTPVQSSAHYKKAALKALQPLHTKSVLPQLQRILNKVFWHISNTWGNYLLKGAIPFFLFIFTMVAAVRRFKWQGFIPYLPALFVMATLLMAMPATDFRYSFSWIFPAPFVLFYSKFNPQLEEAHEAER